MQHGDPAPQGWVHSFELLPAVLAPEGGMLSVKGIACSVKGLELISTREQQIKLSGKVQNKIEGVLGSPPGQWQHRAP